MNIENSMKNLEYSMNNLYTFSCLQIDQDHKRVHPIRKQQKQACDQKRFCADLLILGNIERLLTQSVIKQSHDQHKQSRIDQSLMGPGSGAFQNVIEKIGHGVLPADALPPRILQAQ